jgi:hypothetical protein
MKRKQQEGWSDGEIMLCDDADRCSCGLLTPLPHCYRNCRRLKVIVEELPGQDLQRMREEVAAGFPVDLLHDAQRIHNQLGEFLTQVDTAAKKGGGRCK